MASISSPLLHLARRPPLPPLPPLRPSTDRPFQPQKSQRIKGIASGRWRTAATSYGGLQPLYDDGYLNPRDLADYFEAVADLVRHEDGGPPRWFCPVDCGPPIDGAPLLLYLPDVVGSGMGLLMHHKALGRVFEVRCMHVPCQDRTPIEGLVKFVEELLRIVSVSSQRKPIYLLGDSFGGCLALAVASQNPDIDLILILSNPATCFESSAMYQLFPKIGDLPDQIKELVSCFLCFNIDTKIKMAFASLQREDHFPDVVAKFTRDPFSFIKGVSELLNGLPSDTFNWKFQLLKSAALYANSRLHAIKAEVLVLASGLDQLMPSKDEAKRLQRKLLNCKVHYFDDHGHRLLLESGIHLMSIIKSINLYRHSRHYNCFTDYLPPTRTELEELNKASGSIYQAFSPVMFSTMEDGKIVRGLSGVPNDGPVLVVGNHLLLGLDLIPIVIEFLREKSVVLHGLGHPCLFASRKEIATQGHGFFDFVHIFGGVPVSGRSFYRLLSKGSFILLYPGGRQEALHQKDFEYKLFWPPQPEFVRMCAHFGATIVPFGVVGDFGELLFSYEDIISSPLMKEQVNNYNRQYFLHGIENSDQDTMLAPWILPKIPGRFYFMFGKPIRTSENVELVQDRDRASALYFQVKSDVENMISYLRKKRGEDFYMSIFPRLLHEALHGHDTQIPSFEP